MNFRHIFRLFIFISFAFFVLVSSTVFAQDKEEEGEGEGTEQQVPVEERKTGDSFIENLGELPGDLVTFPLRLVFKGISKTVGWIDFQNVYLSMTDLLTNEDGTRKVRPIFAPSGGGGVTFTEANFLKKGMTFRAYGSFGNRTRRYFSGRLRDSRLFGPKLGLQLNGFYQRRPDDDFFGLGNESQKINETNYLHEESNLEVDLISVPFEKAQFSFGVSYSNVNIKEGRDPNHASTGSLFTEQEIPGLAGVEMWSLLFKFYNDSRTETAHPTGGGEEFFSVEFAKEINGSNFGYRKYTLDLQRYVELFYKRVLAVRVRTEVTDKMEGRKIPFYRLSGLGGPDNLRGYRPVRFRGEDFMLLGAEYRFAINTYAIAYGFFEEGRVFNDIFNEFTFSDFKYSTGGGLRFSGRNGNLTAIFEIAKSKEQTRFIVGLNTDLRRF